MAAHRTNVVSSGKDPMNIINFVCVSCQIAQNAVPVDSGLKETTLTYEETEE